MVLNEDAILLNIVSLKKKNVAPDSPIAMVENNKRRFLILLTTLFI